MGRKQAQMSLEHINKKMKLRIWLSFESDPPTPNTGATGIEGSVEIWPVTNNAHQLVILKCEELYHQLVLDELAKKPTEGAA